MAGEERISRGTARSRRAAALSPDGLYRLATWFSASYPVGAFAYSAGIEWAVEARDITDADTLGEWLETMMTVGSGINDAIIFAQMHRAVASGDVAGATEIAELAAAFVPSRERYEETTRLGRAFVDITLAAWPCPTLAMLQEVMPAPLTYPVAASAACADHGIPLPLAEHAFLLSLASNWVSAGIRLIPLGHTEGQRLLRRLEPVIASTAKRGLGATLDELGSASFRADLSSMKHEIQYTRLFRS